MVINGRNWGFNNSGKFNQVKQLYFDLAQKKSVSSFLRNGGYKMNSKYFDEEKQQKAKKWLDGKANKPCECCGSRVFFVADDLVMPLQFTGGGLTFGGNVYPHLLVICHECGCSRFFSAVVAGIVERKTETEKLIDEKIKTKRVLSGITLVGFFVITFILAYIAYILNVPTILTTYIGNHYRAITLGFITGLALKNILKAFKYFAGD